MGREKKVGRRTRKILEDLAERIIPSGGPDYPGSHDIALVDRLLERMSIFPLVIFGLKIFAWTWELAPLWFFKFRLFTWMSPERQTEFLESWEKSRMMLRRWAILLSKAVFMAGFYHQPLVWEKIGYQPGKCFREVKAGGRQ